MKEEIFNKISLFFNKDLERCQKWYETKHPYISDKDSLSPKQYVDLGRGEEVLKWIKIALDR